MDVTSGDVVVGGSAETQQREREPPDEGGEAIRRCRSCGSTDLIELMSPGGHVRCLSCGWTDAPSESPLPTTTEPPPA